MADEEENQDCNKGDVENNRDSRISNKHKIFADQTTTARISTAGKIISKKKAKISNP